MLKTHRPMSLSSPHTREDTFTCTLIPTVFKPQPNRARPFLRWIGGKRALVPTLVKLLPTDVSERFYVEPFLGAGNFFFRIKPTVGLLSDINTDLIQSFILIRDEPVSFYRSVLRNIRQDSEKHYYRIRERFNSSKSHRLRAVYFTYLNRTCFNGIYRVNREGYFNTPYGFRDPASFPTLSEIVSLSETLKGHLIRCGDFSETIEAAPNDSFIYADPPYPPISKTAHFDKYTRFGFGEQQQRKLSDLLTKADQRGCKFMLSNADTVLVRTLYKGFRIRQVEVRRSVSAHRNRKPAAEVIVTNY